MRSGEFFKATESYVNEICMAFIEPNEDWESIECRHSGSDGISFIRMKDVTGDSFYFDVTALSLEDIGKLVAKVIAEVDTGKQITSREQRKEVAALFR